MAKSKVARKEWYPILAPKLFRNSVLGETLVYEPEKIMGKSVTQNLMNLTNDVKKQGINVSFEVTNMDKDRAFTDMVGYKMMQSSVKRLVRRNIGKIEMSFTCSTSDKKNIRVKPLIITRMAIPNSIATKIRKNAHEYLAKHIASSTYDSFANDLISHRLQESLKRHLSKVYPLRICEIRSMHVINERIEQVGAKKPGKAKKEVNEKQENTEAKKEESKAAEGKEAREDIEEKPPAKS